MKKFLLIFILSSQLLLSQNSINVSSDPVSIDEDFSIGIVFSNTDDISAFQFDLQFDNNAMQLRPGHSLTNRVGNHTISTNEIGDNIIRVVVISSTNETIDPGTGNVVNLNFTSKNEPGSYNMIFSNVVFSDSNGSEILISTNNNPVTILGPKFKLLTTNINFGRVPRSSNQSRTIQIYNEGNQTLEILSQNLTSPFSILETFPLSIPAGSNFPITLTLDTTVSQVVSGQTLFETNDTDETRGLQELAVEADIYSVNEIYVGNNSGNLGSNILIPVSINNMDSFTGFQLDITIPTGVEYVQNSVALLGRENDHSISANVINSNTLRVICFSENNLNFNSTTGDVFSFSLLPVSNSGYHPLNISNSIISNTDFENVISDSYSGSISINAPFLNVNSNLNLGRIPLSIPSDGNIFLSNSGNSDLVINEIVYESSLLSGSLQAPITLTNGQGTEMTVTLSPDSLGQFSSSILINHNGAESQNAIQVTAEVFSPNYLYIEDQSVYRDSDFLVKLGISNNDEIRAIQFDINIPDGFVFDDENIQELNALNDFNVSYSSQGEGNYIFVIYNFGDVIIPSGSNLLLDLPIYVNSSIPLGDYNFEISNITLSDSDSNDVSSEALEVGVIYVIENSNPVAVADTATVLEDALTTSIDVIANDTDVDSDDILLLTAVSTSETGTVAINEDGVSVDYTPAVDFNGTEVVTYTVSDGTLTDETGTLTVTVTPVNDAPTITSTAVTEATEDVAYTYEITTEDIDGDLVTVSATGLPSWLTLTDNTLSGTPTEGETGSEITITATDDGEGALTATQTFTIVVTPVNDAPTITSTAVTEATEDVAYTYEITTEDIDGDLVTVSATGLPSWLTLTDNTLSGTPTEGEIGSEITITATDDGEGALTATQTFTIVVTPVNDAPTITSTAVTEATEDVAYTYEITTEDIDGDLVTVSATGLPSWLTLTDNTLSGTPTEGEIGSEITITATDDGEGALTATQIFTIVVTPVNDAPTITSTAVTEATEDVAYTYEITTEDIDGDLVTVSATGLPSWLTLTDNTLSGTPTEGEIGSEITITATDDGEGALTATQTFTIVVTPVNDAPTITSTAVTEATEDVAYTYEITTEDIDGDLVTVSATGLPSWLTLTDNTLSGTPTEGETGSEITITATDDGEGALTATQIFTIVVNPVNDAPVAVADTATVLEDALTTSIDVIANDTDVDSDDILLLTAVSTSETGTVAINEDGVSVDYTPAVDFNGTEVVTYTVSDGTLTDETGTLTVTVTPVNDAPEAFDDTFTLEQGNTQVITLSAIDIDEDELVYSIVSDPSHGTISIDGDQATYIADDSYSGSDSFTFIASDGELNSNEAVVSIDVTLDVLTQQLSMKLMDTPTLFILTI